MEDNGYIYYQSFLSGDPLGFEQLVRCYRNGLILFIRQYVGDNQAAEDISQNVFVKIYVNDKKYRPDASFKTWLYTIAKHEAINYNKKNRLRASLEEEFMTDDDADLLKTVVAEERSMALYRALGELSAEHRRVLYLRFFEEMSVAEISVLLKKHPRKISDMLYDAKKALRKIITEGGNKYEILRSSIE